MIRRAEARQGDRAEARFWGWHAAAFACYALLALAFIDHGESLTQDVAGESSDPYLIIWFLAWWPWAIAHHLSLLFTPLVWQPLGTYLGWLTSVPLLGVAGWPLTLISPVLTYNFFTLAAPVVSAFVAYLLCLRMALGGAFVGSQADVPVAVAAAIIGGFLFGYSSYETVQDASHLNLSVTLFVPGLLLLVLCRLDDELRRGGIILLGGIMLLFQFLISSEIFGMIFVFGGIVWILAMAYLPERRPVLRRLVLDGLLTAPFVLIPLSPMLISMVKHAGMINLPVAWPYYFTTDLLDFFIPTGSNLFGGDLSGLIPHPEIAMQERGGYLGLPLLLLILLFIRERRNDPPARLLIVVFLMLTVFSLGPRLWLAGNYTGIPMPWTLFVHLPLVKSALPARFALFVSLCCAMMAAWWIASPDGRRRNLRLALGGLACLALLPGFHPWSRSPVSAFFRPGGVQAALGANARLLVLPFSIQGPSSFWQAENHFGFLQTGGYVGFPPKPMQSYPVVQALFGGVETKGFLNNFADFCAATRTQYIVIGPGTPGSLQADIARLHWAGRQIDDVVVYAVPARLNIAGLNDVAR